MIFNSASFLVFFLLFYFIYWIINNKFSFQVRNLFIVIASYLFYGWWDWRFLSLIFFSSAVDYTIGYLLGKEEKKRNRKLLLATSVIVNIGVLGFFKYFNFFVESFNDLLSVFSINSSLSTLEIILPVGISFYTFQTLSYTIDIYRKKLAPTKEVLSFFAFVSFFPQLVAGPIERASHLLPQFYSKKVFNHGTAVSGLRIVLWGFFMKIVIADNFGALTDKIFVVENNIPGISVLIGSLFFALQIYADFSGYSSIAIGISRMLGFDLMTNFSTPYLSKSFSEFWRRWHISLSTWFRDYVYIPLGGNRKGNARTNLNLLITFLLSGLWHGANITFLIWGALHGLALIIEKAFKKSKTTSVFAIPFVFVVVVLFWLPFRAENFSHLARLSESLVKFSHYSFEHLSGIINEFSPSRFLALSLVTLLFFAIEANMKLLDFNQWISKKNSIMRITAYYLLVIILILIGNFSVKPSFIYFQF